MNLLALIAILLLTTLTTATPFPSDTSLVMPAGSTPGHNPLEQIPAHERRGVAYNDVAYTKFFEPNGTHVTWRFNWDSSSALSSPEWIRFVPMLHSLRDDHTGRWKDNAEAEATKNFKTKYLTWLMGLNEPDTCLPDAGGSCIDVPTAVAGWKKHMQPLSTFNSKIYLGSPAVTNAVSSNAAGLGWSAKFMDACYGCTIDFINIHWYSSALNAQDFKDHIIEARKIAKGIPIWVTEFRADGTDDDVRLFLEDVMPWMDASKDVHRYCYFMARPGKGMLINEAGNGLSDIGKEFTFFHKHDAQFDKDGKNVGRGWEGTRWWEDETKA